MNVIHPIKLNPGRQQHESPAAPAPWFKITALVLVAAGLALLASPPAALVAGVLFTLLMGIRLRIGTTGSRGGCCKPVW